MQPTVMFRPSMKHRILAEQPPRLERRADGTLCALREGVSVPVIVRPCFPWSEARRYISLRDDDNQEVVLVQDPSELDPVSREALERALAEAGFLLEVTRVLAVEEEVEIRHWTVLTRQGPRSFQTRLDDWPRSLPGGGFLIRDVAGDLYHIAAPAQLDQRSRELLWAFVD
jgi:uncharacterized protein DUF1854